MPIGSGASAVVTSYVAVGKEGTFGTYASATTAVEALSCSFRTDFESQKLEGMFVNRGHIRRVQLHKEVKGTLEQYLHPQESVLLIANAMAGQVSSTANTNATTHSISAGNFANSIASLSFNVRKGGTSTWRFQGGRCNTLKLSGNVGEPIKASYDLVFQDSTQISDDISANLSISTVLPFTFVSGTYKYSNTEANAANSSNSEHITSFELSLNNNIKSDKDVRSLGTTTVVALPGLRREVMLKVTQRFDTTTTWTRFVQATEGAIELFLRGASVTSEYFFDCTIRLPKVIAKTGDPEIKGPGDVLMVDVEYDVLVDNPSTTTGKDIGVTFVNSTASY